MILTIDAGNSRIKWALWRQDLIVERGAVPYDKASVSQTLQETFAGIAGPAAVYAVCVAGEVVCRAITDRVKQQWQLPVAFLQAQKSFQHIRHAYSEPLQHGADRWAAVVAAHFMYPDSNLCIIGAGTAITFDFIDSGGHHRGGYILPSWYSMRRALTADTANVVSQSEADYERQPEGRALPDNTRDAVNAGLDRLLQAGIRELCQSGLAEIAAGPRSETDKAEKVKTKIIISGGFAQTILNYPDMPEMTHLPDLVMQGLYRIMSHPDKEGAEARE